MAYIFFLNELYIYIRAQMGRLGSAHIGQQTSILIVTVAIRNCAKKSKRLRSINKCPVLLVQWSMQYIKELKPEQALTLLFLVFQDKLLEPAIGEVAKHIVAHIEKIIICLWLEVEIRNQPDANRPLSTKFGIIFPDLDTIDTHYMFPISTSCTGGKIVQQLLYI